MEGVGAVMSTPDDYAAERLAARAEKYRQQVARLRRLADSRATDDTQPEDPTTAYLDARRGNERTTEDA